MKNKVILIVTIFFTFLLLAGCDKKNNNGKMEKSFELVTLILKEGTLTSKGATFILKNNTDKEYLYGADYYIEVLENNIWKEIQLEEPLIWNAIAYTLSSGEEKEINIDWSFGYGELETGKYRLCKKAFKEEDISIDETKIIYLYSEFEIK